MFNLIITLFISLFSICSTNYSVDHNENNHVVKEDSPTKYMGAYQDPNNDANISVALFENDLLSDYFLKNFIGGLAESPTNPYYDIGFQNLDFYVADIRTSGRFLRFLDGAINSSNPLYNCVSLHIVKDEATVIGSIYRLYYSISFIAEVDNSTATVLTTDYIVYVPMYYNSDTLGLSVVHSGVVYNDIDYGVWVYYENTYDTYWPILQYFYYPIMENRNVELSTSYQNGYDNGVVDGYASGYVAGIQEADNYDATALTIFTGIISVGLMPINVFLQILNFEVFGINISGIVSAFLTISLVIIIIRVIFGGKNDA